MGVFLRTSGPALLLLIASLLAPGGAGAAAPDPRPAAERAASPLGSLPGDEPEGLDWASAAVGAAAVGSILALAGASLLTVRRRRIDARSEAGGWHERRSGRSGR